VLAGAERLDTQVRWVHVGEVREIAGLLQGGELILSTGLAMRGAVDEAVAYLRGLAAAGAAGLVVELGEAFPAVPTAVVAAARSARFPLVTLRARVRFVEITEAVHRAIVAEQLEQVEFARDVHETFTRLSLESADPTAIVRATSELCGSSVVLEDLGRHVVAFEARGRPAGGLLADWERRSRAAARLDEPGVTGPEGWVAAPVGLPARRWGRLVVPDPQVSQARLATVLERAAQALELGRMVERDRLGLELQAQGGLLSELAAGRIADERTARARVHALGLVDAARYIPVVARRSDPPGSDPVAEHDRSRTLVELLVRAAKTARVPALVGPLGGPHVGLLLGVPAPDENAALARLANAVPEPRPVLGVGPSAPALRTAGAGLAQAAHVADVAAATTSGAPRAYYLRSDIRLHGLVALLADDPRLQAFVEAELGPLLAHEAQHADGMLDLLRQYVEAGGNKTRLAAATHRSRPALYKRLARLGRVLGVDLDDPLSLASLTVAVLAYDHGGR
jgi:purine catabolism regulator